MSVLGELSVAQLTLFAILVGALALLVTEWLRNDVVAALIVLSLAGTGLLSPVEALAGSSRTSGCARATSSCCRATC